MKSIDRLLFVSLAAIVLIMLGANLFFFFNQNGESSKPYMIDINRAYTKIVQESDVNAVNIEEYTNLTSIIYLSALASAEEKASFFTDDGTSIIKPYGDGYIRFDYVSAGGQGVAQAWLIANISLLLMGIVCIASHLYIRSRLVKPFSQISEMPYELSKGHIALNLKQNKSRYFGRFLWGLDMLRETLEARKRNELELTKVNKMMVLALSHDIKTPLSAIRLYAKALSEDLYDTEQKRYEVINNIDTNAQEIEGLVRDIIKTSREDFLHIEVNNDEFYLSSLIDKLKNYYDEKLSLLKCEFVIERFRDLLIYGDIERYVEVAENIIENAIKYGDGREIRISFPEEEDIQMIAISNTGNTLPDGEIVHIWESFWRGSNSEAHTGNGLGLYICRQLMVAMKGDIYAEKSDGHMVITIIPQVA